MQKEEDKKYNGHKVVMGSLLRVATDVDIRNKLRNGYKMHG